MGLSREEATAMSVAELVRLRAETHTDRGFVVSSEGTMTFAEAHVRSERLAAGLHDLGVRSGDNVAVLLANGTEILIAWFALAKLGAVEVPINTAFRGASLEYLVNHSQAEVLIAGAELLDNAIRIADRLENLREVVVVGDVGEAPWPATPFSDLLGGAGEASLPYASADDLMAIMYTSGTTGYPKGVMESHRCSMHWGINYSKYMDVGPDDANYLFPPLFHAMSQFMGVVPALLTGSRVVLSQGFSASSFWEDCRRDGVTLFNFTGGVLSFLWKQPRRPEDGDNPVRRALGVPIPDALYPGFEERFDLELLPPFGTSESNVVCYSRPGEVRKGSSGRPIPEFDVAIVDDEGQRVPPGVRGEIVTRPKYPDSMMRGYYRQPEKTVEAFRDLWYHTGDLGFMDEDGYLFFVDRKKDAIRRRGENISSFEIERVVDRHPAVLESAAVGVPSEHGEEEVKLAVVLRDGMQLDAAELWGYCEEELPAFMVPRYLEFRQALPKTPTERVRKFKVRDEGIHEDVHDRESNRSEQR